MTINTKSVRGIKKPEQTLTKPEIELLKRLNLIYVGVLRRKPKDFGEYIMVKQINHTCVKVINSTLRVEQSKIKKDILNDSILENRNKGIHFYIASQHQDCAADHLAYQGKVYVDKSAKLTDLDRDYLRSGVQIMSIQAVTSKPIWFVTRPYCRHYFVPVKTEDLVSGNYKIPTSKLGDRRLGTEPTAQVSLEYYRDRLALLEALNKVYPSEYLKNKILKTKVLIAKWRHLI